jgi:hypothetical protein
MSDMLWRRRDFKAVQIDAAKNVTGIGRGRFHFDVYRRVVMKPCSACAEIGANRRLFAQAGDTFQNCEDGSSPRTIAIKSPLAEVAALIKTTGKHNMAICEPFSWELSGRGVNALSSMTIDIR